MICAVDIVPAIISAIKEDRSKGRAIKAQLVAKVGGAGRNALVDARSLASHARIVRMHRITRSPVR